MQNKLSALCMALCLLVAPLQGFACANHFAIDPEQMGFFGGALVRAAGLAPPEPVYKLKHPHTAVSAIDETAEITVEFKRPFFSSDVSLELKGTKNVRLLDEKIELDDRSGTVTVRYELTGRGYDFITLTTVGKHKGETVREHSRVFLRASRPQQIAAE